MSRILLIIGTLLLLVLAALIVGATMPFGTGTARSGSPPAAALYAARGPYPVGMRHLAMDDVAPLEMVVWYPADGANPDTTITYPYKIGMPAPFGTVKVARYQGRAERNAPFALSDAPYPLVVLSPGLSLGATAYGWLAEHLASHGLVVVAPEHAEQLDEELDVLWQAAVTRPGQILEVLAYVDEQAAAGGKLEGLVDTETVAVIGHSYGGYTALAVAGARFDTESFASLCEAADADHSGRWLCDEILPHVGDMAALAGLAAVPEGLWPSWSDVRVDAVVSMAGDAYLFGEAGLAQISAPVLAIGGTADEDSPYMWGTYPTYEYASSPAKVRIALDGAEHMIFTGPCEAVPLLLRLLSGEFCADTSWDRYYAHDLSRHFTTAFLLSELKQDRAAARAIASGTVEFADVTFEATGYRPYDSERR